MGRADARARRALADAEPAVYWTSRTEPPAPAEPLPRSSKADLAVVGGGLTGLWAAVLAKLRDPGREVVLLEKYRIGGGGSARSGGFLSESLTHGLAHGAWLWPEEIGTLVALGRRNLAAVEEFVAAEGIDAGLRMCGKTSVATEPHQVGELSDELSLYREHGFEAVFQGAGGVRADIASPTYRAGLRLPGAGGLVDPARLTWGLARSASRLGVAVHEDTPVRALRDRGGAVDVVTPHGTVRAAGAVVATNAFPPPLRGIRRHVLPVWDHVLVTEPLADEQWRSVGWRDGQGVTDSHNNFHYYRPTPDGRILWGGSEAHYYFGGRTGARQARRPGPYEALAAGFFDTFPQLEGIAFTHRWGGPIDSTARFTPVFGTRCSGRVAYAVGYTGLGLAASRFGAGVALDLLRGEETELTRPAMVRQKPVRFPPEPLRWPLVQYTRRALAKADARGGRRGRWLRHLDRRGIGLGS
ncbi:glycine/D-amino acid oxidase-like deaminating enzyme [Saccharopolyspora erythraea NRRL 2338]|uniref:FAD dependent oxidoreductase n=2 Tax=Saccharopolyspora erythraea TaxID=1836 RepID=A4FF66_SACEN|nr:FAD-dependent oxidoreductase [Saccharopolyspora erythraea]EQD86035.1 FAD-dependent oxidoreductase [Saccharopolyspora erythraea D]PFG96415.1 glycine/D-amino acid oxidase-like deaminating enzyme [Saccharopolyspora erythraea NRRL 2338]QRK92917.1 FAD-dependent oxidoreductase [Saccharopolyspora erythraea]CAM02691.1 FAD dependent oxidoreductase [Saccharopolyspora erythraea NRRL 2338]